MKMTNTALIENIRNLLIASRQQLQTSVNSVMVYPIRETLSPELSWSHAAEHSDNLLGAKHAGEA